MDISSSSRVNDRPQRSGEDGRWMADSAVAVAVSVAVAVDTMDSSLCWRWRIGRRSGGFKKKRRGWRKSEKRRR